MAGVIQTSQSFANGDSVTSTKLNAIATGSSFTSDAVTGTGLTVTGAGTLSLGTVASSNMGTNSVLTASIADNAVTAAKLSQYAPKWSAGLTYLQSALELGPELLADSTSYIDFHSSFPSIDFDARIIRNSGVNGTFDFVQLGTGSMNFTSPSGFKFGAAPMPTPSGSAPIFGVRAWVTFDMNRNSSGGVDSLNTARYIYASGNVSTVVKNATGDFTVNFTTAMPDTYYTYAGSGLDTDSAGDILIGRPSGGGKTTTGISLKVVNSSAAGINIDEVVVSFIR